MKIIVAPDSFKGSSSSVEVAGAVERGIRKVFPDAEVVKVPIADGGEGTVEAVVLGGGGEYRDVEVTGPLAGRVTSRYGLIEGGRAVIEMAAASGLTLIPENRRNPLRTTTRGTGELIADALDQGCTEILIGIGGSATNDAGVGMAQALGYSFRDATGKEIGHGGGELSRITTIDPTGAHPRLPECTIRVACDVRNPLYGVDGAAHVYGPQKGATPEMVETLDRNLRHFASVVRGSLGKEIAEIPGSGAAGGLGAGLVAFCGAELRSGIESVLDIVRFDDLAEGADLVITGEGAMDGSSLFGKVPVGVAARIRNMNIPVIAIVGAIGAGASRVHDLGIDAVMSIVDAPMALSDAMKNSQRLIEEAAERLMRIIRAGARTKN